MQPSADVSAVVHRRAGTKRAVPGSNTWEGEGESEGVAVEAANGEPVTAEILVVAGGPEEGPAVSCRVAWRLAERTSAVHGKLRGLREAQSSPPRRGG